MTAREYVRRNTEGDTVWGSQSLVDAQVVVVGGTAVLLALVTDVVLPAGGAIPPRAHMFENTFPQMPFRRPDCRWALVDWVP